jgi:heptosyltransferase-2
MLDFSIYLLYRAGSALLAALPLRVLFALGNVSGFFAWVVLGKYRRLAFRNISLAFGNEKPARELRRLVRRHFQRLGANLLCSVKLTSMPLEKMAERIEAENLDLIHRELRAGRPVVLILSHLANWELFAHILPKYIGYVRNGTIYQRLGNRFIDEHVRCVRGRAGVEMFDRKDGFDKAIKLLRGGGVIGVLSDQHAGDHGLWVPFFGRLASTSPLPALLARRTGAALIGAALYTSGIARWRMVVTEPLQTANQSVESLTAKVTEIVAQQIRRAPEDWFWVHNRWKTPRPNFLLTKYKRGVYLPPNVSGKDLKPFRILVRASNWLGDSVMSVPSVCAIKNGRPDAHITVAAPEKIASIWKLVPEVDEIIRLTNQSLLSNVRALRQQPRLDVAILFPNSLRAALEVWLGGIPRRVGYRGHWRRWLLNQIVSEPRRPGPPEHHAKRYLRIAQECGAETYNAQRPTLNVQVPSFHQRSINAIPARPNHLSRQSDAKADQPLIGLCAGAEYGPAKRWLPERFAEAAVAITAQSFAKWILFGTKNDTTIGETITAALGDNCVDRIGQTTLEQLIDELRECRLLLTNDTGTMHLACLIGVPVVAIFGSTEPRLTGPLGGRNVVFRHQVECSPCFLRECPIDFRCMKAVGVQKVVDAVLAILQKGDRP